MGRYGGFELSLRQRRRRDVRARAGRRAPRPQVAASYAQAVVEEVRRLLSLPAQRPAAGGRRRPAARGQERPDGAHASSPTPPTTRSGRTCGSPRRCSAPTPSRATPTCVRAVHRADRPAALPGRGDHARPTWWRYAGSRRASTTSGCRAAPTATPTSSSAAAASPTSSGPCSCCRCGTPARSRSCARPQTLPALQAAAEADLIAAEDAETLAEAWRLASRVRNAVTLVRGKPSDQLPARRPGARGGGAGARLPARGRRTRWSTTTSAPPGGRTRSWSGCSGNEASCFILDK